jgi:hypothetical protein
MWLKIRFKCIAICHNTENESNYPVKYITYENKATVNFWGFKSRWLLIGSSNGDIYGRFVWEKYQTYISED